MMQIKLGPRLQAVASYVPVGAVLGDIGTDHAYLPVYLLQQKIIRKAIGVEKHKGPYESALQNVRSYGLAEWIDIRFGDGLKPLQKAEVDTLTIAGMGGTTILEILAGNPPVLEAVTRLILQPQGAEAQVRLSLLDQGWKIVDECLVEEDKRIYNVLCFSRLQGLSRSCLEQKLDELAEEISHATGTSLNNVLNKDESLFANLFWQFGPLILLKKDQRLKYLLNDAIGHKQKIIQELKRTHKETAKVQAACLRKEILLMEVVLKWLLS